MKSGTIRISKGTKGNGHYVAYYWSFIGWEPDGSRAIVSGNSPTFDEALSAATKAQQENFDNAAFEDMCAHPSDLDRMSEREAATTAKVNRQFAALGGDLYEATP